MEDAHIAFKSVSCDIVPEAEEGFSAHAPMIVETVFFGARAVVRNAARQSRATHPKIQIAAKPGLTIQVGADGIGPSGEGIAPVGAGQGLVLHSAMTAVIGGKFAAEPREGGGTLLTMRSNGTFLKNDTLNSKIANGTFRGNRKLHLSFDRLDAKMAPVIKT